MNNRIYKKNAILLLALIFYCQTASADVAGTKEWTYVIWDGEADARVDWGDILPMDPYEGENCLVGSPNAKWGQVPALILSGLPSNGANISAYDEVCFYAKCDQEGKTFGLSVYGWPNMSNVVSIDPYIEGGPLDTAYRLVRIPIDLMKKSEYRLDDIEQLHFISPNDGITIFIDKIWAVQKGVDFGAVQINNALENTYTLRNYRESEMVINTVGFEGTGSGAFSTTQSVPFTVAPGGSTDICVKFLPATVGEKEAALVLQGTNVFGDYQKHIPLYGKSMGSIFELSDDSVCFGKIPIGQSIHWNIEAFNGGNQDLHLDLSAAYSVFSAPASVTIPPNESRKIPITFTPVTEGTADSILVISSDDINATRKTVALKAEGLPYGATFVLPASVNSSSSKIAISWGLGAEITGTSIYIGPEPGDTEDGPLPGSIEVASLSPETDTYTITGVSAATDVFIRIEQRSDSGVVAVKNLHVRTDGGPRASLDTPLREVHLAAPNIIMLTLENKHVHSFSPDNDWYDQGVDEIIGYEGPEWQAGPWTVTRANGTSIGVSAIYRNSIPVAQLYLDNWRDECYLDVDHIIYLVLDQEVGSRDLLRITGPKDLGFYLPFSDRYLETPVIQINQVGYSPRATERYAYVSWWLGDGGALSLDSFPSTVEILTEPADPISNRAALPGLNPALALRQESDTDSGGQVKEIDLSSLPHNEDAVYRIRIPGVGVSWPTKVSEAAVFKAFLTTIRGMTYNRWGREMKEPFTGFGPRPQDHPVVYDAEQSDPLSMFAEDTPATVTRTLRGGHHDAGDFDIRLFHWLIPLPLLRTYELSPERFTDSQLNIPESGNGIPDILDEALYSLKAWEELQDFEYNGFNPEPEAKRRNDGGIRLGVESYRHPPIEYADENNDPYWTYSKDRKHSARVAGMFALAARIVAPFDAGRSAELRARAIAAYDFALMDDETTNSLYGAPLEPRCGNPLIFAAGELFALTGETRYRDMVRAVWDAWDTWHTGWVEVVEFFPWPGSYSEAGQQFTADQMLSYVMAPGADSVIAGHVLDQVDSHAAAELFRVDSNHAHRNGRYTSANPDWGAGTSAGAHLSSIYSRLMAEPRRALSAEERQRYINAISLSADYVLGANPYGTAWITGLGTRHPREPLHSDSLALLMDGQGLLPGIPVYGPVGYLPGNAYYDFGEYMFYPQFGDHPLMRRYADIHSFVNTNEFDIGVQAGQSTLFAMLLDPGTSAAGPRMITAVLDPLDDIVINFGSQYGLWIRYNDGTWTQLAGLSPNTMAGADTDGNGIDDLIIDFGSPYGIWIYRNNASWEQLTGVNSEIIITGGFDTDDLDDVAIDFGDAYGIWIRHGDGTWEMISNVNPECIVAADMDGDYIDDVVIDFGASYGIWARHYDGTWDLVSDASPESIATGDIDGNGKDDMVIDFGASYGIWARHYDGTWDLVSGVSPDLMAAGDLDGDGKDDLVIDFGTQHGTWVRYGNGNWAKINDLSPN
ncbi:MAG: glycoside hydrolase family 9 protein [Candidatus Omnitrophota bacterium]